MAATGPNFIDFVSELVYGDLGVGELGTAPPAGAKNHIHWTRDNIPNSVATTVTGDAFLAHHLDYMLARYEAWRSKNFLPPLRPWDGQSPMDGEQSASVPGDWPLPATTEALGTSIREYYNSTYRAGLTDELADEVKAAYSYRYWAFVSGRATCVNACSASRSSTCTRCSTATGQCFRRRTSPTSSTRSTTSGIPISQKERVGHRPRLFFKTSVCQHSGKKEISGTQVGAEFFTFHRDHLEIFDRWLLKVPHVPAPLGKPGNEMPVDPFRRSAAEIICLLDLQPHPEGGFFRETFRDPARDAGLGLTIVGKLPAKTARYSHFGADPARRAADAIGEAIIHELLHTTGVLMIEAPKMRMSSCGNCTPRGGGTMPRGRAL